MKKIFSKKYWTTLVSVTVLAGGVVLACADGWIGYGTSNFTPEAFVDSGYRPFFYSEQFYYYIGYDTRHDRRFNESIVNDWSGYFENQVPAADLEYLLLYESSEAVDSAVAYVAGRLKVLPPAMKSLKIFTARNKKTDDFINYLALAKKSEAFALNNVEDWWQYKQAKNMKPAVNVARLNADLQKGFAEAKDVFLKQRYWFQLVRSYFFNTTPKQAIDLFESNQNIFPKNKLYYRTMAYAAGAYYDQKNYSKANYYYSKVYDASNELKTVAHFSFRPQEEDDWKATLALCRDKAEEATLWQMLGVFYSDPQRAINEIYKLDPKSEKLDLLLVRAINKEEEKFRVGIETPDDITMTTEPINADLVALINRIATAGNTSKPYLWYTALGYLSTLRHDFSKAQAQYALAEKTLPKDNLATYQLRLLKLINKLGAASRIDSKLENEIAADIDWLSKFREENAGNFRYNEAQEWVRNYMSLRYKQQGEIIKSECFRSNKGFYGPDKNVEAMKAFLDKQGKSPFEQVCQNMYVMKKPDLLEYQGIRLTYEDKLADAIIKMEGGAEANKQMPGNPFNGRIQDCHDCDHEAAQKIKYTKLSLLRKMKEMQDKITAGEDVYNNAMLLANAHYNITHYGNARFYYESKVIEGAYTPGMLDSVFQKPLTDMKLAAKYYNLALQSAKTDEQKAKCHYMLAKCERNEWYNKYASSWEFDLPPNQHYKAWNGFKVLEQYYYNTQYYKDVIKECGYFRTYVAK